MSNISDPAITISWKNTLNCNFIPDNLDLYEYIDKLNYPYYCFNGFVFNSNTKELTGVTREDLDYYFL